MNTLGTTTRTKVIYANHGTIDLGFVANEDLPIGAAVQLRADGLVEKYVASGKQLLGYVTVAGVATEKVTVRTGFDMVINAKASAAVVVGAKVIQNNADTATDGEVVVVTGAVGDRPIGTALQAAGAADDYINVGLFFDHEVLA